MWDYLFAYSNNCLLEQIDWASLQAIFLKARRSFAQLRSLLFNVSRQHVLHEAPGVWLPSSRAQSYRSSLTGAHHDYAPPL